MNPDRTLPWDWYAGRVPDEVVLGDDAYIETAFSFQQFRGEQVVYGRGAHSYLGTMFDVAPGGRVTLGDFALVHGVRFICDVEVRVGDHALLSWNVVLMDTYRAPEDVAARRAWLRRVAADPQRRPPPGQGARPVRLEDNVWLGFDVVVLPGVTIGEGAVVGARSVVFDDVPPYTIAAGNPARVIREVAER